MSYNEYFSNGDKPFAENLNDSLLLVDAFDLNIPIKLPDMYKDGEFNSSTGVVRKAGVALVTITNKASGVTIGSDSITGTGKITFRFYPNFNQFYKWYKVAWTCSSGSATVDLKETDGTTILSNITSGSELSSETELSKLQEVDVVVDLSSATLTDLTVTFVNNHSVHVRPTATLEQANVDGLITSLAGKEDVSHKKDVINDSSTEYPSGKAVYNGLALKENVSNKKTSVTNSDTDYPTGKAVTTALSSKEDTSNKKTSITNSSTHYPASSAVYPIKQIVDGLSTWTETFNANEGQIIVEKNTAMGLARVTFGFNWNFTQTTEVSYSAVNRVPEGSRPGRDVTHLAKGSEFVNIRINEHGSIYLRSSTTGVKSLYGTFIYSIQN